MENQPINQPQSNQESDTMSLGDFMASGPATIEKSSSSDTLSLDEFMGGSPTSSSVISTQLPEEHKTNTIIGFAKNLLYGANYAASQMTDKLADAITPPKEAELRPILDFNMPSLKDISVSGIQVGEKVREETKSKNFGVQIGNDLMFELGNMGVTLPVDIYTGGVTKELLAGKVLPGVEKILSNIPDFALGQGWRNMKEGVDSSTNPLIAAYKGIIGFGEGVATGKLYGDVGGGKSGFISMPLIGASLAYYDAAKDGRVASNDEVMQGAAKGFAYQLVFAALPHLTEATQIGVEKTALGYHNRAFERAAKEGDYVAMVKAVDNFQADERIRPEIKQAVDKTFETLGVQHIPENVKTNGIDIKPDILKAIQNTNEIAKRLGVEHTVEFINREEYLDATDPQVRKSLLAKGYTKEDIDESIRRGEKAGIYGRTLPLQRGISGQKIQYFNGHRTEDIYHELAHAALEQGKIKGITGHTEEQVFALAKTWMQNAADKERSQLSTPTEGKVEKPVEQTNKETKTTGLANRLEQEAVKAGIIQDMENKTEYSTINHEDQAKRSIDLVNKDYELAKRIAIGEEQAPDGLKNLSVYNAVKVRAIREGDTSTIRDLGTSKVAKELSEAAQTLGLAERRDPLDPVNAIRDLSKTKEEMAKKRLKVKDLTKIHKDTIKEIKESIKKTSPTKQSWSDFVKSIQC